jgi:hypothetical protein
MRKHKLSKLAALLLLCSTSAFAAVGGLDQAKSIAEDVKTGLYALVGVVALIYLIYLAAMAFTEKKTWSDFGWGVVHVAIAGATLALGAWAWSLFS